MRELFYGTSCSYITTKNLTSRALARGFIPNQSRYNFIIFSVISVSAGHQFAVNRWNPGYTGGKTSGQASGQPGHTGPRVTPGADQSHGQSSGQVAGSGGSFVLFLYL